MIHFADCLNAAVQTKKSPLCLGLDPHFSLIPESLKKGASPTVAIERFLLPIIDACAPHIACVKPNTAFFEEWGYEGIKTLETVCAHAKKRNLLVIVDAKRGDIGSTAAAYARAFLTRDIFDALTINPYLGEDGITPFVEQARKNRKGLFVLVKTSNPSSGEFQDLACGEYLLHEHVAHAVARWGANDLGESGFSAVGAVVGATYPDDLRLLRAEMPAQIFLLPGYGAQGACATDLLAAFYPQGRGAIVSSSRQILFAGLDDDYVEKAQAEAMKMKNEFSVLWE